MLLINSWIAVLGVISLSPAVVARHILRRGCSTVTVLSTPETETASNHVQLASYEMCGSTLSASLYIYNDDYDKIVTLYYLTSSGTTGSATASYSSSLSNNWELWTLSTTATGAVEITGASYVDSDASVTYTTSLDVPLTTTTTSSSSTTSTSAMSLSDCTTVTVLSTPETETASNHVQLASYEMCGSTLSASLYIYNDDYDKIVTLYYLTSSGTTGSATATYSSSLSNNWELWTLSITATGAVEITGASYVDSDASVTYTTSLDVPLTTTTTSSSSSSTSASLTSSLTSSASSTASVMTSTTRTSASVPTGTAANWRGRSIYQIVTDRFARTDGSTTYSCDVTDRAYCGGSYQGIINMLDYIQGMGFTAIWISPIVENIPEDTGYGYAYHGYWMKNIFALNTNFGTAADLIALATELHNRGMYLMVDIVVNHFAFSGNHADVNYSEYFPYSSQDYFHSFCWISDYSNQSNVEVCWLGDDTVPLVDVNTQLDTVKSEYQSWVQQLIANYSIDGLRIDTVKHVQMDFWAPFQEAAGVYAVGEVFDGDPSYTCPYQENLDGVLNYPVYFPVVSAFKSVGGSISSLVSMIDTLKSECTDTTLLGSFLENQDNPRFPSYTSDESLIKNAIAYTILSDGIPIIYYGQEQGLNGGNDPYNREALWLTGGYSTTSTFYKYIASLNQIRNQAIYKDDTYLTYQNWVIYSDSTTIAMRKGFTGNQVITVLSNLGSSGSSYTLTLSNTGYTASSVVYEVLTCTAVTTDSAGNLAVPMSSGLPRVFYPKSQLVGSGICSL
ncbi:glycoside hydrolase superfamily [Lipomyces kononenkoae]|uniref:Glycoside hydrolase superfamily n=1 Tax=Lipomyces kononenkoae TaxID=34357 RepID=A0ACC3SUR5_LIPKO